MRLPGKGIGWKEFATDLRREYKKDKVNDVAAGLTYYGVLALFPFLLFLVSLAGLVMDPAQVQRMIDQAHGVIPEQAIGLVQGWLGNVIASSGGGILTFGIVAAIWAASSGIAAVMRALNTAYDVDEGRPFWKVRGIAVLVAIAAAAITIVATLIAVAVPPLAERLGEPLRSIVLWARIPVAGLFMMFLWALMYWVLPDVEQRKFRFITPGSVFGVVVWMIASWLFSLYVKNFGHYDATYGALGGAIVMLLWMWITAQVVLLGAEINALVEHRSPEGKRPGAKRADDTGTAPTGVAAREERARMPPPRGPEGEPRQLH